MGPCPDFAKNADFADAPRDQLRVLRSEIEDQDFVGVDVRHVFSPLPPGEAGVARALSAGVRVSSCTALVVRFRAAVPRPALRATLSRRERENTINPNDNSALPW